MLQILDVIRIHLKQSARFLSVMTCTTHKAQSRKTQEGRCTAPLTLVRLIRADAKLGQSSVGKGGGTKEEGSSPISPARQDAFSSPPCISFGEECWRDELAKTGHEYLLTKLLLAES